MITAPSPAAVESPWLCSNNNVTKPPTTLQTSTISRTSQPRRQAHQNPLRCEFARLPSAGSCTGPALAHFQHESNPSSICSPQVGHFVMVLRRVGGVAKRRKFSVGGHEAGR